MAKRPWRQLSSAVYRSAKRLKRSYVKSRPQNVSWAGAAGAAVAMRRPSAVKKERSIQPTGITTYQTDVKTSYQRRRAPRYVKKRAARARKRFISQQLKVLGSKKFHYHGSMNWATTTPNQAMFGFFTYGMAGIGGVEGSGEVKDVITRMTRDDASGDTRGLTSRKFFFDTMTTRCSLTNTGTTLAYVEMYTCICRKDIPVFFVDTTAGAPAVAPNIYNFTSFMNYAQTQQGALTTAAAVANADQQTSAAFVPQWTTDGVTPFQFRWFCQRFTITACKRFQISGGNSISFQMKDTKNRSITYDNEVESLFAKAGWTKLYLFRVWGQIAAGTDPEPSTTTLTIDIEKDYNIKRLDSNLPELAYINYTNHAE